MSRPELVIRGGTVIDGTGAAPRRADVAVVGDRIVDVGEVPEGASDVVDATGLLVTPGFVDIHAHYDGQATWEHRMVPSSWHGVTTVVAGNCGVGFAPVHDADHDRLVELMEGVEDIPGVTLHEGLAWNWRSFPEFLDALDGRSFDVDVAVHVPHAALRLHVMGERGANREPATAADIEEMGALAAEAVEAGAIGFSTSRTTNHRTSRGEPTPTLTASVDELVGIAAAIGRTGQGVLQLVSDFVDVDGEFDLCRRMVVESGRPLSFSLLETPLGGWRRQLELLAAANDEGLAITAQVAPRAVGVLLGLDCTLNPFITNPVYRTIADLPLEERFRAMSESSFRERLLQAELGDERGPAPARRRMFSDLSNIYELADPPDYEPDPGSSIEARARREGREPVDLAYDLLLGDEGRAMLYLPFLNYGEGNLDAAREMLVHPNTVVGLGDGGAHVGTICDASFPTTLLAHWGRDRGHDLVDLPLLVHRQTSATAKAVGLLDRGVLAPGYRADLNLIDFDRLVARRPEIRHDLPAGGRRLVQRADGYVATYVAGQRTYAAGEEQGPLPGRLLRGPRPAPIGGTS
jgi:N-acyl-D-aspartate/D-glutamate deacylase